MKSSSRSCRSQAVKVGIGLVAVGLLILVLRSAHREHMRKVTISQVRLIELCIAVVADSGGGVPTLEQFNRLVQGSTMEGPWGESRSCKTINNLELDPWGRPIRYAVPGADGRAFDVWSYGADGEPGGAGPDEDIGTWRWKEIPR